MAACIIATDVSSEVSSVSRYKNCHVKVGKLLREVSEREATACFVISVLLGLLSYCYWSFSSIHVTPKNVGQDADQSGVITLCPNSVTSQTLVSLVRSMLPLRVYTVFFDRAAVVASTVTPPARRSHNT